MSTEHRTAVVAGTGRLKELVAWGLKSMGVERIVTDVTDRLEGDVVVLAGGATQSEAERMNAACRDLGVPFVWADACASTGFVFTDFGEVRTEEGGNGSKRALVVTGVTQDGAGGIVTIDDSDTIWDGIKPGQARVVFSGMRNDGGGDLGEVLEKKAGGHLVTEIIGEHAFRIETDTSRSLPFSGCGYATAVPVLTSVRHVSLADSLRGGAETTAAVSAVLESDDTARPLPSEMMLSGIVCSVIARGLAGTPAHDAGQWTLQDFSVPSGAASLGGSKIHVLCAETAGYTKGAISELVSCMGGNKSNLSFDDNIEDGVFSDLDVCIAVNADIAAAQQLADRCVSYEKPLFVASSTSTGGEVQVVIPHKTAAFDASRHRVEHVDYPLCVLQNFPYRPEHTVSWATSKLSDLITATEKPAPSTLFDTLFRSDIERLVDSCQDTTWSGLKRRPRKLEFDKENAEHRAFVEAADKVIHGDRSQDVCREFVNAAGCLRADNYGIPKPHFDDTSIASWPSVTVAVGFLLNEVVKFVSNSNGDGNNLLNASIDLVRKSGIIDSFVPKLPLPVEKGSKWTVWDCVKVSGEEMTLLDLVRSLKKMYRGTVTAVIYRGRTILVTKKNKKTRLIEALETATKTCGTFGNGLPFVTFDVIAEDADGEDVDIPRVKYYPK